MNELRYEDAVKLRLRVDGSSFEDWLIFYVEKTMSSRWLVSQFTIGVRLIYVEDIGVANPIPSARLTLDEIVAEENGDVYEGTYAKDSSNLMKVGTI